MYMNMSLREEQDILGELINTVGNLSEDNIGCREDDCGRGE